MEWIGLMLLAFLVLVVFVVAEVWLLRTIHRCSKCGVEDVAGMELSMNLMLSTSSAETGYPSFILPVKMERRVCNNCGFVLCEGNSVVESMTVT